MSLGRFNVFSCNQPLFCSIPPNVTTVVHHVTVLRMALALHWGMCQFYYSLARRAHKGSGAWKVGKLWTHQTLGVLSTCSRFSESAALTTKGQSCSRLDLTAMAVSMGAGAKGSMGWEAWIPLSPYVDTANGRHLLRQVLGDPAVLQLYNH